MSDRDDELELQALQRELDDAFATTRPRRGFEEELWTRMQVARPAQSKLRDAIARLVRAIREVPAVPAAGIAAVLVIALGAGLVAYSGLGRGGGGASSAGTASFGGEQANSDQSAGGFGRVPAPALGGTGKAATGTAVPAAPAGLRYMWSGSLTLTATTAPVYRYHEPTPAAADELASSLGAVLRDRPDGLLGSYSASTYTLNIAGTRASPPSSPTYFMIATPSMPAVDAASSNPADVATVYLAGHNLIPDWQPLVAVDSSGDLFRVRLVRQFQISGYGPASLVDPTGEAYGIEVDLQGNRPILVKGMLPVTMDSADYRIITPATALQAVLSSAPPLAPSPNASAPLPVQLTKAELVYVLVPAGDHSYYEPAYMFSGTAKVNGVDVAQRVLVPAVDPSQRTP